MRQVTTEHYLSHLYGAIKANKATLDRLNSEITVLKANSPAESNKKILQEMVFQQAHVYITIVLLTNSMVEALANHYLANKCDEEQFEALERLSTLDKLVVVPKMFLKEYESPKQAAFYEDLSHLFSLRRSWVHPKPRIVVNGQTIHKGELAKKTSTSILTPDKCLSLPVRLVEHLCLYDHGAAFELAVYSGFDKEAVSQIISKVQAKSLKQRTKKTI